MIDRDEVLKMAKDAGIDLVDGEIYGSTNGAVFALVRLIESRVVEQTLDRVSADLEREELLATSSYTAGLKRAGYVVNQLRPAIRALNDGASGPNPPTGTVTK